MRHVCVSSSCCHAAAAAVAASGAQDTRQACHRLHHTLATEVEGGPRQVRSRWVGGGRLNVDVCADPGAVSMLREVQVVARGVA